MDSCLAGLDCSVLKTILIKYEAHSPLGYSKLNKHGFHPDGTPAPRGLGWQVLKTMLIRHETIFIPPGSTTSKPQTPSRCPGSSPFYTKTKLRENTTNNPEQRCICSKHGLSLASTLAPGDSGRQPSNTMLSRCATRGHGESAAVGAQRKHGR